MLRYLKETVKLIIAMVYFAYLKISDKTPYRLVIYYHGIDKADIASFRRQMESLARSFTVVKPSEIMVTDVVGSKNVVAITFDDAFASVIENAVPILRKYKLPAGIFVPVDNLGQKPRWEMPENCSDKNEFVMNKDQIVQLDRDGFEIFSHTSSHLILTGIEDGRLEAELFESKQVLERIVNHEVVGISYPHGAYDTRVGNAVKKGGYKIGFTIEASVVESNTDCLKIGRFSVSPRDNMTKFKLKVSGAYQAVRFLRVLKTLVVRFIGR